MMRESRKKGGGKGDRTKVKIFSNVFLRSSLYFAVAIVIPSLVYVNLNVARTEIPPHPSVVFKEKLDGFHETSSRKDPAIAANNSDFSVREKSSVLDRKAHKRNLVLTAYLEPPGALIKTEIGHDPFIRNTSSSKLRSVSFPNLSDCSTLMRDFPVDDFPLEDPFLPWIHDYFPSVDGASLHFVAQNRRKCDTGLKHVKEMEFWSPQVALFQGVPVVVESTGSGSTRQSKGEEGRRETTYRLASSFREATHNSTRFQCRFHHKNKTVTSLSVYPFDYEFLAYMKRVDKLLRDNGDKDVHSFWLNQLLFSCHIPEVFQPLLSSATSTTGSSEKVIDNIQQPALYVDLIPIRTPPRNDFLFESGADDNLERFFGRNQILPPMDDAGRWQNLPICPRSNILPAISTASKEEKPHRLVACTWTSSSYSRRGESYSVSDSVERLKEWIQFHLMVGFDHLYIYDNTDTGGNRNPSVLYNVTQSFGKDKVTYHAWPCKICNNNRPGSKNPGVRSSQYAAENSCRIRYGDFSEWMAFIDTDEYMVPMKQDDDGEYSWHPVLDEMEQRDISTMKFLSSKAKPRIDFTESLEDQTVCTDSINTEQTKVPIEPCVGPMKNKTFLQVYNCDYIRPPKPQRFDRAMKQIYRTSVVLLHFVHYTTVTTDTRSLSAFEQSHPGEKPKRFSRKAKETELFMDEMTQGVLLHTRSVLPHETMTRSAECFLNATTNACPMGFLCEDNVEFVDELHKKNVFHNSDGSFCNCWRNKVIEEVLVPKLEKLLSGIS